MMEAHLMSRFQTGEAVKCSANGLKKRFFVHFSSAAFLFQKNSFVSIQIVDPEPSCTVDVVECFKKIILQKNIISCVFEKLNKKADEILGLKNHKTFCSPFFPDKKFA